MRRIIAVFLLFLIVFALPGCRSGDEGMEVYSRSFFESFDTVSTLRAYVKEPNDFTRYAELFRDELWRYHRLFDIYNEYEGINNLKTVNDRAGEPVEVDSEIIDLLELSVELYDLTGGMTNVAMGSVLSLWHDCRENAQIHPESASVPDPTALVNAAEHTNIRCVEIDRATSTVWLTDPDLRLAVGAIAKGYAAGKVAEKLREAGLAYGIVNVGGNTVTIGSHPDGQPWRVGIQNPDPDRESAYLCRVALTDRCLVTSGSYERYFVADGVRYHHIIHPETLFPKDTYLSVSVLAADSGVADALSTALFNMDPDEGQSLIASLEGIEAYWVLADGSILRSAGFADYEMGA